MEKIVFQPEGEKEIAFYILEQTKIGGNTYILVTDSEEDEDGEALILRELPADGQTDSIYEIVDEKTELDAIAAVFSSLLEDTTLSGEGYDI